MNSPKTIAEAYIPMTALNTVAFALGTSPEWLKNLIWFESKWNPLARNIFSSAKGLIQLTDAPARELGFASSADAIEQNPTATEQLYNIVLPYLTKHKPLNTEQALYMAVFYPAAQKWNPWKLFPPLVLTKNPGIMTPADYIYRVSGKFPPVGTAVILLLAGLTTYILKGMKV